MGWRAPTGLEALMRTPRKDFCRRTESAKHGGCALAVGSCGARTGGWCADVLLSWSGPNETHRDGNGCGGSDFG